MLKTHGPLIVQWGWFDRGKWEKITKPELQKDVPDDQKVKDPRSQHAVVVTGLSKVYDGDSYILQHNPWGQYEEFTFNDFKGLIEGGTASIYYYMGATSSDVGTDSV